MKFILGTIALVALLAFIMVLQGTPVVAPERVSESPNTSGGEVSHATSEDDPTVMPEAQTGAVLDFEGKGLTSVPASVFSSRSVTVLNLSHNALTGALPAEVRQLSSLTRLDLSHNTFTGVPAEVGQLTKLEYLDLSYNPITGLPYEIGNLKNLKELDLRGTNYASQDLQHIRESLPQLTIVLTD